MIETLDPREVTKLPYITHFIRGYKDVSVSDRVFICINRSTEPDYTGLTDIGLDQVSAISVKLVNSVKLVTMDYDGPFFEMYKFMKKKKKLR